MSGQFRVNVKRQATNFYHVLVGTELRRKIGRGFRNNLPSNAGPQPAAVGITLSMISRPKIEEVNPHILLAEANSTNGNGTTVSVSPSLPKPEEARIQKANKTKFWDVKVGGWKTKALLVSLLPTISTLAPVVFSLLGYSSYLAEAAYWLRLPLGRVILFGLNIGQPLSIGFNGLIGLGIGLLFYTGIKVKRWIALRKTFTSSPPAASGFQPLPGLPQTGGAEISDKTEIMRTVVPTVVPTILGYPVPLESTVSKNENLSRIINELMAEVNDKNLISDARVSQTLSNYRLIRKIGEGGMGEVWTARHERFGYVIIKSPNLALPQKEEIRERFAREVDILSGIKHPNIMRIWDYQLDQDQVFYVGEYVEGMELGEFISYKRRIPLEQALVILYFIVKGLEAANKKGIVHRDLKPDNVMMTPSESLVKLIDFGIARDIEGETRDPATKKLTIPGTFMGTVEYMPPEMHDDDVGVGRLDHRADIFGSGLILYEMLTGKLPREFEGGPGQQYVQHHKWSKSDILTFPDMRSIPPEVQPLLQSLGEKNPDQRISSYEEIERDILDILNCFK